MSNSDPQQEIINTLARFIGIQLDKADPTHQTFQFLKERSLPGRKTYFVLVNHKKEQQRFICYVLQNAQGDWELRGAAGGGIHGNVGLVMQQAWANLDGGGLPDHFHAGGYIAEHGQHVALVRLRTKNGVIIEDSVDSAGIVLFLTDQKTALPIDAELYDPQGELICQQRILG